MTRSHVPSTARASIRSMVILMLVHLVYTLDRTVPIIIAEEVRKEFGLSDSQLGLFTGLAYGLSFAAAALLSGPLVDRFNRTRLLALMLFLWSGLTAVGALVTSYWQLLILRLTVGAAEAGGSPAALSIMADMFPANRRGSAIGFYKIGSPLGYLLASAGCGFIASEYGWRAALLAAGIPGMLLALAVIRWVPDPRRGAFDEAPAQDANAFSLAAVGKVLGGRTGLGPFIGGYVLFSCANAGLQAFIISFLARLHGVPLSEASSYFALSALLGAVSPLVLGLLNDRLVPRGLQWAAYLSALVAILAFVGGSSMLLAGTLAGAVVGLLVWQFLSLGMTAINLAGVLSVTPPAVRGTVISIFLVGGILVGMGLGPLLLGGMSDLLGGGAALREAGVIILAINLLAALSFWIAGVQIGRSKRSGGI